MEKGCRIIRNLARWMRRELGLEDGDGMFVDDYVMMKLYWYDVIRKYGQGGVIAGRYRLLKAIKELGLGDVAGSYVKGSERLRSYFTTADVVRFKDGSIHYKLFSYSLNGLLSRYGKSIDDIESIGGIPIDFYKKHIHNLQDLFDRVNFSFLNIKYGIMEKEEIIQNFKDKSEYVKHILDKKIETELDDLVDAAISLAKGIRVKGSSGVYEEPPDKEMLKYLLDHYFGRPTVKKKPVLKNDDNDLKAVI